MPDTVHQSIIAEIQATLGAVLVANGYQTDLGQNVFYNTPYPMTSDDVAGVAINEQETEVEPGTLSGTMGHSCFLNIQLETYRTGATGNTDIHENLQDIVKALGVDRTRGGNAVTTTIDSYKIEPFRGEINAASAIINITVEFFTDLFNFTQ
jgi:hypothetical protein